MQLNFKTHELLFINILKRIDQDEQSGSTIIFVYHTLLQVGITGLVMP